MERTGSVNHGSLSLLTRETVGFDEFRRLMEMVSPYVFYENEVKGKNEENIRKTILELKDKMRSLKDMLECPDERRLEPRHDLPAENLISAIRECLKLCVRELKERGINYSLDETEQRAEDFRKNLDHISKVSFSIGGYFGGYSEYFVEFTDGYIHATASRMLGIIGGMEPDGCLTADSGKLLFTKSDFLHYLSDLNMGEWMSVYWPDRFGWSVMDGTSWDIAIEYDNGIPTMKFSGSNSYPYNFDRFQCLFGLSF